MIRCIECVYSYHDGDNRRCRFDTPISHNTWPMVEPTAWCGKGTDGTNSNTAVLLAAENPRPEVTSLKTKLKNWWIGRTTVH